MTDRDESDAMPDVCALRENDVTGLTEWNPMAEAGGPYKKTHACVCFSTLRDVRNAVASARTAYGG